MPTINGTIKILFYANHPDNTVCYTIDGGSQTCISVSCPNTTGTWPQPCGVDIPITVESETCTNVEFDGYIESDCNEDGAAGQIPWSYTYYGDGGCSMYTWTCVDPICSSWDPGLGCDGLHPLTSAGQLIPSAPQGTEVSLCVNPQNSFPLPPAGSGWDDDPPVLEDTCCYDCVKIVLAFDPEDISSGNVELLYMECNNNRNLIVKSLTQTQISVDCVINQSWTVLGTTKPFTVTPSTGIC